MSCEQNAKLCCRQYTLLNTAKCNNNMQSWFLYKSHICIKQCKLTSLRNQTCFSDQSFQLSFVSPLKMFHSYTTASMQFNVYIDILVSTAKYLQIKLR